MPPTVIPRKKPLLLKTVPALATSTSILELTPGLQGKGVALQLLAHVTAGGWAYAREALRVGYFYPLFHLHGGGKNPTIYTHHSRSAHRPTVVLPFIM